MFVVGVSNDVDPVQLRAMASPDYQHHSIYLSRDQLALGTGTRTLAAAVACP